MWDYAVDMKSNYSQQKPMSEKSQKLCKFVSEIMLSHIKYCEKNVKPDIILFDWFLLPYLNMWEIWTGK
jgi:hypothetical protein